ncbi:MAG: tRNA (adenosine(37)-N6)-dimethylallyltransferase MiaA [Bacteroidales bacterium]|nr:MAG: tRNA (adenosine(37)-N6)-dimethylallyltransferase MiaA [Bacteroidales bacterium]
MSKSLIVITGPTGIGKSRIAISVGKHFQTQIISADSRQIYREMKIGTAVPPDDQLREVKHHFIGTKSIHEYYNASMFEAEVMDLLEELYETRNILLLAGGSGLYLDAVTKGIDDIPSVDPEIRKTLKEKFDDEGIESLRRQLKILDPEYYGQVDLRNHKRILKAIEISIVSGRPYSSYLTRQSKKRNFNTLKIGLTIERDRLYDTINKRVDQMIRNGLIDEARLLFKYKGLNALNSVGYSELFDYFENKISLEEAINLIKRNSRRYAKRQISWFSRDKEITWFHPDNTEQIISFIEENIVNNKSTNE